MNRRRLVVTAITLAIVAVSAIVLWPRSPRPCLATFRQVQPGMTREQVYATVGGPPGDYTDGPMVMTITDGGAKWEHWASKDAMLFVRFGTDDRVLEAAAAPMVNHYAKPSFFEILRRRLGL